MRVLVCGDRKYRDFWKVSDTLADTKDIEVIIHGAAKGADTLAGLYGLMNKIPTEAYPADWNKHGKAAGPIRNTQMLKEGKPDKVIAFLAKDSKGTKNMIEQATKANIPVEVINI